MREIEALLAAGAVAVEVLGRREVAARWGEPSALRGYTVGGLAGHLLAAVRRPNHLLDQEPPSADTPLIRDLAGFYGVNRAASPEPEEGGLHALIREAGEQDSRVGPTAVTEAFADALLRLAERLPEESPERRVPVLSVPGAATALRPYLASRVVEIVVHTDDLVASVDTPAVEIPPAAADVVFDALVTLARARAGDVAVLRAFTRVERAPSAVLRVL